RLSSCDHSSKADQRSKFVASYGRNRLRLRLWLARRAWRGDCADGGLTARRLFSRLWRHHRSPPQGDEMLWRKRTQVTTTTLIVGAVLLIALLGLAALFAFATAASERAREQAEERAASLQSLMLSLI